MKAWFDVSKLQRRLGLGLPTSKVWSNCKCSCTKHGHRQLKDDHLIEHQDSRSVKNAPLTGEFRGTHVCRWALKKVSKVEPGPGSGAHT